MSLLRLGRLTAMVVLTLLCLSCGQTYRPVVIPLSITPPTPANFHAMFAISANAPNNPGGAMQVDVAGDSIIGETPTSDKSQPNLGDNPTYATVIPNDARVFVTSAGSVQPGGVDLVSSFTPAFQTTFTSGLGAVTSVSLPTGSQPVFVGTAQNTALYVANFGTNSVSAINEATNAITNTAPVGLNPVALAETQNARKLYVANQGGNSVSSLNTADLSPTTPSGTVAGFTGTNPVWVVARADSQRVYVLTQGDGQLVTIDTVTDTAFPGSLSVGVGANFIFYDLRLNRLYVTNPVNQTLYVFSDTGGASDTPSLLQTISFAPGSAACPVGCSPVSVTGLADGSRFYVASYYLTSAPCPDPLAGTAGSCLVPRLTVFDANSFALKYPTAPTLSLLSAPFAAGQFAVAPLAACGPVSPGIAAPLYSPGSTRFRIFTAAAVDSSRVYVSICDAGVVAVVNAANNNINQNGGGGNSPDTLITDLPTAYSAGAIQANGFPPNQNPILLLSGQ